MTTVSVTLIIIGIICVVLSIVFNFDKGNETKQTVSAELTKEQQDKLRKQISDIIESELEDVSERTEASLDKISNTKILEMNEYVENVLGEINRNHNETVFLYDMLNEKAKEIKSTVKDVNITKRQVEKIHAEVKEASDKQDDDVIDTDNKEMKDIAKERLVELVKISDSNKDKPMSLRKTQAEELERKKVASEVDKEVFKVVDFATEKENIILSEDNQSKNVIKAEDGNVFSDVKLDIEEIAIDKEEEKEDDILSGFEFEEAPAMVKPEDVKNATIAKLNTKPEVKAEVAADEVVVTEKKQSTKKTTPKKSTTRKATSKKTTDRKIETLKKNINAVEFDASESNNDRILKLSGLGFSNKDIAKFLNLGIGEVKLVVDLYKETK